MTGRQSLRMEKAENGRTVMTKIFSLPLRAPFAVSERAFAIVDREALEGPGLRRARGMDPRNLVRRGDGPLSGDRAPGESLGPSLPVPGPVGGGETRLLSVSPTGTYYIYGFDGRLLAEYNGLGICVRDYIYMGGKLIAEYRPQENAYFYYTSDQISSTRIVTDDSGAVVYAAAHDPYGGIQQTWTSAYDPALKFSGKERDTESGLDYFGARYYDHSLYRFLSVDPVIPAAKALFNPQRWNLYAYCLGNPVNYVDPDGAQAIKVKVIITFDLQRISYGETCTRGWLYLGDLFLGYTLELPYRNNIPFDSAVMEDIYRLSLHKYSKTNTLVPKLEDKHGRTVILMHWFPWIFNADNTKRLTYGCIGYAYSLNDMGHLEGGTSAVDDMAKLMHGIQAFVGILNELFGDWFELEMIARINIRYSPKGIVTYTHEITGYVN